MDLNEVNCPPIHSPDPLSLEGAGPMGKQGSLASGKRAIWICRSQETLTLVALGQLLELEGWGLGSSQCRPLAFQMEILRKSLRA